MITLSEERLRNLLAWLVMVLIVVPIGGAVWLGVADGESPCILCWSQRTSMMLIALTALFVVRYGPRPRYLGMLVLLCGWGIFMATRHSALHLARDIGQGFAAPILGVHTYVWAWIIHWVVLLVAGVLLLLFRGTFTTNGAQVVSRAGRFAMLLLVAAAAANAMQAFVSTGPPPFIGQADPVRLSLNPRHWVWMNGELEGRVSWRGAWTVPKPDPSHSDPQPARGPLASLPSSAVKRWEQITAQIDGNLTDLAVNARGLALAVTDQFGVYLLDSTFARVLHRVVLDPGFSIDLSPLAGAAFLNGDTLAVLSDNKGFVLLRADSAADDALEWRHFLETDGRVSELRRARFATVRARQQYVQSLAYDAAAAELITISIPSPRHQRVVVSRFDRADFILASEFLPRLADGLVLSGPERALAEYVVTGATVADGKLYAISAAFSTLLVIDLQTRTLTAAYAVPGISTPVGLAARGHELLVAQQDGRIAVLERPL